MTRLASHQALLFASSIRREIRKMKVEAEKYSVVHASRVKRLGQLSDGLKEHLARMRNA